MTSALKAKVGLIQFLGSNCDQDCMDAFSRYLGVHLIPIWHSEVRLPRLDGLILPGGFSYGDFLRSGTLAAHTQIMSAVKDFAQRGGPVLGICNGFQVLTESRLLPGALIRNESGKFACEMTELVVATGSSGYHKRLTGRFRIPIAHGEGRYFIQEEGLRRLHGQGQILFTYKDNPNGSVDSIAGVISENGRVLGMMPHPERACDSLLGSQDGLSVLKIFLEACVG